MFSFYTEWKYLFNYWRLIMAVLGDSTYRLYEGTGGWDQYSQKSQLVKSYGEYVYQRLGAVFDEQANESKTRAEQQVRRDEKLKQAFVKQVLQPELDLYKQGVKNPKGFLAKANNLIRSSRRSASITGETSKAYLMAKVIDVFSNNDPNDAGTIKKLIEESKEAKRKGDYIKTALDVLERYNEFIRGNLESARSDAKQEVEQSNNNARAEVKQAIAKIPAEIDQLYLRFDEDQKKSEALLYQYESNPSKFNQSYAALIPALVARRNAQPSHQRSDFDDSSLVQTILARSGKDKVYQTLCNLNYRSPLEIAYLIDLCFSSEPCNEIPSREAIFAKHYDASPLCQAVNSCFGIQTVKEAKNAKETKSEPKAESKDAKDAKASVSQQSSSTTTTSSATAQTGAAATAALAKSNQSSSASATSSSNVESGLPNALPRQYRGTTDVNYAAQDPTSDAKQSASGKASATSLSKTLQKDAPIAAGVTQQQQQVQQPVQGQSTAMPSNNSV